DHTGRVPVQRDLSVDGRKNIFVVGDLAHATYGPKNTEVPGIAPAAMQMGRYVAKIIRAESSGRDASKLRAEGFRYNDKGMLATIGRARAVGVIKGVHVRGPLAWLIWAVVHVAYLIGFRNRLFVMLSWAWAYIVFRRGARLITGQSDLELSESWVEPDARHAPLESVDQVPVGR
ncbi:MAG TPA: hypothetical protein VG711_11970, partial [Phycisphaerales bacterium]|nr:hypothetical protein [Phycisphaerales bacterium]